MIETKFNAFQKQLDENFEKFFVAFLNSSHGGSIFIGINNEGKICGVENIDQVELEIKDRIKNNISPSTLGLFEIITLNENDLHYLQIVISSGNQKPYYIKKYGMCPEGCYFRIGTASEKMSEDMILQLFQKRERRTLISIPSPYSQLTFDYLLEQYKKKGYEISNNHLKQLEFYNQDEQFNYLAFLMSDQNNLIFQYARYQSDDVFDLVEQKTFTQQSILKTTIELLDLLQSKNTTYTEITGKQRKDTPKFNTLALREIVINAIVHNDYRSQGLPIFEEFSNRFEISSFGGLPSGFSKEDFLNGYSLPQNPEMIRIFRDLGYAERLGTGIRRVLKYYPKEIFRFSTHFLRVNIPFYLPKEKGPSSSGGGGSLLEYLKEHPHATRNELALVFNKSTSTIFRELSSLVKEGKVKRVGANKNGYWEIL